MRPLIIVLVNLVIAVAVIASELPNLQQHAVGIWSVSSNRNEQRWVIIHNLEEAKSSGIYHIEVIKKAKSAPPWAIKHVIAHMAITTDALQRSVLKPLNKGLVYPESFDSGLAKWRAANNGNGGAICNTSISACASNW